MCVGLDNAEITLQLTTQNRMSMKKRLYSIFWVLLLAIGPLILAAQSDRDSTFVLVYRTSAEQARTIYTRQYIGIHADTLGAPVDSTYRLAQWRPPAPGHYIFVWADKEQVVAQLSSYHSFRAKVSHSPRHLLVQVFDTLGRALPQAQVVFRDKALRYNAQLGVFELPRQHKDGMLTISIGGETAFYQLTNNGNTPARQRWRRISSTAPARLVLLPYNVLRRTYSFVSRGIRGRGWYFGRLFGYRRERNFKGYMAFSKPRYLPGDTVKMAAQVARHNGKPVHRKLRFGLSYYAGNKYQKPITMTLKPGKIPGYYQYQWKLPDSLPLNISMNAALEVREDSDKGVYGSFRYEDYQLDEVTYTLKADTSVVVQGRPAILRASGKDKNDFPVVGGSLRLSLLVVDVSNFYDTVVVVPDTLWTHSMDFDEEGLAVISIPDSVWPRADLNVSAVVVFSNDKGELQQRASNFAYSMAKPILYLQGDTLVARWSGGQSAGGVLQWQQPNSPDKTAVRIPMPYRMVVNPNVPQYTIESGGLTAHLQLNTLNNGVSLYAYRHNDTLELQWTNLRNLTIGFRVFDRKKVLYDEQVAGVQQHWQGKIPADASVRIEYYYVWAGENVFEQEDVPLYSKLLRITTDQAGNIAPGATTPVEISVSDYKGRPARKVRLTAGAINSQFNSTGNYEAPEISYKTKISPINYGRYSIEPYTYYRHSKTVNSYWYKALHLQKYLFYRLLFEGDGVYAERNTSLKDSFYQNIAQFAPYIVKGGKYQPIHLIYCNRQLVYSYDVNDEQRYSFVGIAGSNDIVLRTTEAEYTIKGVALRKGEKLEFAIHADNWHRSVNEWALSYKPMPQEMTQQEKQLLNRQILMLDKTADPERYVWVGKNVIHRIGNPSAQVIKLGPFTPKEHLNYATVNGFKTHFLFEPGFVYQIFPQRERLYAMELYPVKEKYFLPAKLPLTTPGMPVFSPADIITRREELPVLDYSKYAENSRKSGMASLSIQYGQQKGDSTLLAVILQNEPDGLIISPGTSRNWKALPAGQYSVWLVSRSGQYYLHKKISLKANAQNFFSFENTVFERDSTLSILRKHLRHNIKNPEALPPNILKEYKPGGHGLSGVITDDTGEPLIGATVLIKGTATGTVTDVHGRYYLDVPPGRYELIVSYTGYNSQEVDEVNVDPNTGTIMDVLLSAGNELSEVVVTGFGISREKKSLSYALTSEVQLSGKVSGVSIRGSRSLSANYYVDGIRIGGRAEEKPLMPAILRSDFRDEAYWQPGLVTNRHGKAYFVATYPDNITAWNTYVVGMDKRGRAALSNSAVRAYKPLVAQLAVPRFLVRGDAAHVLGTVLNTSGDSLEVTAKFGGAAQAAETHTTVQKALTLQAVLAPEASLQADSVSVEFIVQSPEAADGELRKIPVVARGTKETSGAFWMLEGDTAFVASIPEAGSAPMQVYAQNNILPLLLKDLEELRKYPYYCNEQISSKLIGLLLEKSVRKAMNQPFTGDKEIGELLGRLARAQQPSGGWGWWPGNEAINAMTIYVLQALSQAQQSGYTIPAFERGMRLLTLELPNIQGRELMRTLALMAENNQNLDYEAYLSRLSSAKLNLYDRLLELRIRQLRGLPHNLDLLLKNEQRTMLGGSYWGRFSWNELFDGEAGCTLLAYKIADSAGRTDLTKRIRHYFMESRSDNGWRNTIETAQILNVLLVESLDTSATVQPATLQIDGKPIAMPFRATLPAGQNNLQIKKQGLGPVFLTAYRQWQNPDPQRQSGAFEVTSHLEQNGKATQTLAHGQAARLIAELTLSEAAEYVMIEIPIPAGCSYLETNQANWSSGEVHREYRRDKVVIFCTTLLAGRYTFAVELEPRFTGQYALNPAKAELMYFPTFFGREGMKTIDIHDTGN